VLPQAEWSDPDALDSWLHRAVTFVGTLPPKEAKPKKSRS
jgi:hypothetical protein